MNVTHYCVMATINIIWNYFVLLCVQSVFPMSPQFCQALIWFLSINRYLSSSHEDDAAYRLLNLFLFCTMHLSAMSLLLLSLIHTTEKKIIWEPERENYLKTRERKSFSSGLLLRCLRWSGLHLAEARAQSYLLITSAVTTVSWVCIRNKLESVTRTGGLNPDTHIWTQMF